MNDFYDQLAPFYSLIYGDWDAAIARQATQLSTLIQDTWGTPAKTILDVSCGIGTQALGLAEEGYHVTASDLSSVEIKRARIEAQKRGLEIPFSVCDMRQVHEHQPADFDVVISCDNAVPHLLTDADILQALRSFYACTRSGGGCLITVRDYDQEAKGKGAKGKGIVKPYGIREADSKRYLVFQVWDFEGTCYDLAFYFVEEDLQSKQVQTHVMRSRYYALSPNHLMELMEEAGFKHIQRLDQAFFQPVLIGLKNYSHPKSYLV
ncbi:MAG: class I SAM-dependent methyltransferase [Leptolyngbya sp. SIO1D8]|nr:class I SAM-dependent methyltransferase [Leptolyngbya sp. SIO1D8]